MSYEDFFYSSDLDNSRIEPTTYSFSRPWGVPVRYHDFSEYESRINPDLWEFHFSYSDLDLDPKDFFSNTYTHHFVVHAPELFSGSMLMDLHLIMLTVRSLLSKHRELLILRMLLSNIFQRLKPLIVANIGGFTMDEPFQSLKQFYYDRFALSLSELDLDGVELIPQTMAPFPWHFGGQRYQNLFVHIDEIVEWCDRLITNVL